VDALLRARGEDAELTEIVSELAEGAEALLSARR
jgi:hypothetical protein